MHKGYPESKDTTPVKVQGIFAFRNGSAAVRDRNRMTGQSSPATVTATLCSQYVFKMAVSIQNPASNSISSRERRNCFLFLFTAKML
jgi:hypothetical protein